MMSVVDSIVPANVTSKRLTELEVNAVFSCVENNELPPEKLNFKIIRVHRNAMKLSPPSFEYEDGLYLLLRSDNEEIVSVPPALANTVLSDSDLVSLPNCPWSLSGPQCYKNTGKQTQQRYCYPRGNTCYSNGKGGVMWTKVDVNGREDINCRLLHVYCTTKRNNSVKSQSQGTTSRQPKRTGTSDGNQSKKKYKQLAATGSKMNKVDCASHGGLFFSPCPSHLSIDLDGNFDFENDYLLGNKGSPCNQISTHGNGTRSCTNAFSFIPIKEICSSHDTQSTALINPAYASAYTASPANHFQYNMATSGHYYGPHYHSRYPAYPEHLTQYGNAQSTDWIRAAPPIPRLPVTHQNALVAGKTREQLKVVDFSQKLKDFEYSLLKDILDSSSAEKAIKLQVLQSWAKGVANKPLQTQPEEVFEVSAVSACGTQPNIETLQKIKVDKSEQENRGIVYKMVEDLDTPRITPGSNA